MPSAAPSPTTPPDAITLARQLKAGVPAIRKIVKITEDNDPNNLIGRPNGYVSAAVLYDRRVQCSDDLGVDCGATIEVWPTATDAKRRAAYIEQLQKDSPILGTEYHTLKGSVLLRVAGDVKPSQAKIYAAVFGG